MNAYFGYINRPYCDISGVLNTWASMSERFIAFQHDERDGSTHTHTHILVMGIQMDKKQLYKRKDFRALGLDGTKKEFGMNAYEEGRETLRYMTKGIYRPVLNKGFTEEEIADAVANGYSRKVANDNANDNDNANEQTHSQKLWIQLRTEFHKYADQQTKPSLMDTRRFVLRWFYKKQGMMPFAPTYKRYASTLYYEAVVRASNRNPSCNCESIAIDELLDWSY